MAGAGDAVGQPAADGGPTGAGGAGTGGSTGFANTGGGGGGAGNTDASGFTGGAGGSGIVILRYSSYLAAATSTTGNPDTYIAGPWRVYRFEASGTITF